MSEIKEIVKYDNVLNEVSFKNFTENDFNLFMSICAKMRDMNDEIQVFAYDELMEIVNWDKHQSIITFHTEIQRVAKKLLELNSLISISPTHFVCFNLFSTFSGNYEKRQLTVRVNPDFAYILNGLTKNFTAFELKEYIRLKGRYSKQLYQNLKQFKNSGWWQVSVDDFRHKMSIPDSMATRNIQFKVILPSIKEVSVSESFKDLKFEIIKENAKGTAIIGYKFTWTVFDKEFPENNQPKTSKFNDFKQNIYDFDELESVLLSNK